MPARAVPKEKADAIVKAVQDAVNAGYAPMGKLATRGTMGALGKAAADLGVSVTTLRSQVEPGGIFERTYGLKVDWAGNSDERRAARGELGFAPVLPGYEITSTAVERDADGTVQKEWIKQGKAPGSAFEMPDGHVLKGVSTLVDGAGRTIASWIKTREDHAQAGLVEAIRDVFDSYRGRAELVPAPAVCDDDLLTVYAIPDLHLGLYAWSRETGADYDLEIAENILINAMSRLVAATPRSKTAIILNLGDFFHADSKQNRTAQSGNVLDVDTRWPKVLQTGVKLLRTCIDLALAKHERVVVRCLAGNHDDHSSIALSIALACFYEGSDRITVDSDPSKFFFHQHGSVLISATHGDMVKPDRMAGVVAAMQPQMWGQTSFRFGYQGHIHSISKLASEGGGMVVETFQTLAAKDAWHHASGYCAGRSMTAISHHKDHGEHCRNVISYSQVEAMSQKRAA